MSNSQPNPKNRLVLDVAIRPNRLGYYYYMAFMLAVFGLALAMDFGWWQYVLLGVVGVLILLGLLARPQVVHLACTQIDGVWQLSTKQGKSVPKFWQGYFVRARRVGVSGVVMMNFYVIEPKPRSLALMIAQKDVSDDDFRRLLGLCCLNKE